MFDIISKEVMDRYDISGCDSDEDDKLEDVDDSRGENQTEQLIPTPMDHDYYVSDQEMEQEPPPAQPTDADAGAGSSHRRSSRSYNVLQEIKALITPCLAKQEQNFSRMISLMEQQVSAQNKLTAVVSNNITGLTVKHKSRKGQNRTEPVEGK